MTKGDSISVSLACHLEFGSPPKSGWLWRAASSNCELMLMISDLSGSHLPTSLDVSLAVTSHVSIPQPIPVHRKNAMC